MINIKDVVLKRWKWMLVAALLLFGLAWIAGGGLSGKIGAGHHGKEAALYYCPMHPTYTSDKQGDCPICNMKLVRYKPESGQEESTGHAGHSEAGHQIASASPLRVFTVDELVRMKPDEICLLHKCKMGKCMVAMTPEFARLGKCPHCGEDLGVIVKDYLPDGYAPVRMAPEKQNLIGVKTAVATRAPMTKTIRTVGNIAYDPELYQAEEEYLQAARALRSAEAGAIAEVKTQAARLVESAKLKLKLLGLSDELITELETQDSPDRSLLYAESGGTVWLYTPIYEYEIPLVRAGENVEAELAAVPGKRFEGVIRSIDPVIDPATRTVRVRAVLNNADNLLRPQMFVNATLKVDLGEVLSVPAEAVFSTGARNIVFVVKRDGLFEPRNVSLGVKAESLYEIKDGLAEGEIVVTSGNFLIDSESRLKAALESAGSGGGHQHGL